MALETNKPSFGVLDDVKVVYAAVELAAPKACDLMADWGADVTWLENTGAGDTIRDTAYVKQAERRNQRSVSMNYFSDEGKEILFKMLADADVFIEASKGGTWARKGITDEVLWEINPKLVIVHLSGFGQSGDRHGLLRLHEPERHAGAADEPRPLRWRLLQLPDDRLLHPGCAA